MLKLKKQSNSEVETYDLLEEYALLDDKLTAFRLVWNRQARKDLEYAKKHGRSKGKQKDFPVWWHQDVKRWKELQWFLNM